MLLDQGLFLLDQKKFEAFNRALDAPVKDNPALRKLMDQQALWE